MIVLLRDTWNHGTKNMVAQTRLASSYGLLQMMYSTAVEREVCPYPSTNPSISPEDINVTDTNMTYSLKYMKELLVNALTPSIEADGNWPSGFEAVFKNKIWHKWNKHEDYPGSVYSFTQWFLPQNN